MAKTVMNFNTSIQIPNSNDTVTSVDLLKISDGLFFLSEPAYYITKNGITKCKFVSEISYDMEQDNLKCECILKADNNEMVNNKTYAGTSFTLEKELIEQIFRSIIEEDQYIFDIDFIHTHISIAKKLMKNNISKEKKLLIFCGDEITGLYGKAGDGVVFNRILFEDINKIYLAELLFKDSKSIIEEKISMFLNNGMTLIINIEDKNLSSSSAVAIRYVGISGEMTEIKLEVNNQLNMKNFNTDNIFLPEFNSGKSNENSLVKALVTANNEERLQNFYKANKAFFAQRINILQYMLD